MITVNKEKLIERVALLASGVDSLGTGSFVSISTIFFLTNSHVNTTFIGIGLTLSAISGMIASVPIAYLADRLGKLRTFSISYILRAIGMLLWLAIRGNIGFLIFMTLFGIIDRSAASLTRSLIVAPLSKEKALSYEGELKKMNNFRQYAILKPHLKSSYLSVFSEADVPVNEEVETGLSYNLLGAKALLKTGKVAIVNNYNIAQIWLQDENAPFKMRIRREALGKYTTTIDDVDALVPSLDIKTLCTYTHTVKHKVSPFISLEINTPLKAQEYTAIANLYTDRAEINKRRYTLAVEGISPKAAIVTLDMYSADDMRLEVELTNPKEIVIIPQFLFDYSKK